MKNTILYVICGVLFLTAAVLGYLYFNEHQKLVTLENENRGITDNLNKTKGDLDNTQKSIQNLDITATAVKAVVDSFIPQGDLKVSTIDKDQAALATEKINAITDEKDKAMAKNNWSNFTTSKRITDLHSILLTLADNLKRSIQNATVGAR